MNLKNALLALYSAISFSWLTPLHAQSIKILGLSGEKTTPLSTLQAKADSKGIWTVLDGKGNIYVQVNTPTNTVEFKVGGYLGWHKILFTDAKTKQTSTVTYLVDANTLLEDGSGKVKELFDILRWTLDKGEGEVSDATKYNGKIYYLTNSWFQDNLHSFRGYKYFNKYSKDYVDLFTNGQKSNGMVYDNYKQELNTYKSWLTRFGSEFVSTPKSPLLDDSYFIRIPVENMGEFSLLEAVYMVWKATGDDDWMASKIDNCLKAINYTMTDGYRWSKKFKLTKRGYTIDVWDFKCDEDNVLYGGDIMMIDTLKGRFGIHFGDNLGMAVGCEYVAEMLEYIGRKEEAKRIAELAKDWRDKIDALAWNGAFYRHWIPEDAAIKRDFGGTDETKVVTLSNSWVLNRRISHEKAVAIIKTYQNIRAQMPKSSVGEWYLCYPPFEKGWNDSKWEYMNGGVSPIVAGQLSKAAFEHGFEDYGSDILDRVLDLAKKFTNGYLECTYRGNLDDDKPNTKYTEVSLKTVANASYSGTQTFAGCNPWTNEGDNDFVEAPTGKVQFQGVPFNVMSTSENNGKQALILWRDPKYTLKATIPVNQKAKSIYIYHTSSDGNYAGSIRINYADGTYDVQPIIIGEQVNGWWFSPKAKKARFAWQGKNARSLDISTYVYGFNVNADKTIKSIECIGSENGEKWMILGVTLSDQPVYFKPDAISYGIPNNWGAGEVMYALAEGISGVTDLSKTYNSVRIAPRWSVRSESKAKVLFRYAASHGYAGYEYTQDRQGLTLVVTGNASTYQVEVLCPKGKTYTKLMVNGVSIPIKIKEIEKSIYATATIDKVGVHTLRFE